MEVIWFLIEKGIDVHHGNDKLYTWAINNREYDLILYLVEHGVSVRAHEDVFLRLGITVGKMDLVKYYYEHAGIEMHPNSPLVNLDIPPDIALRYASHYGRLDIFRYLVETRGGISLNNWWHAFSRADQDEKIDIMKYMMEHTLMDQAEGMDVGLYGRNLTLIFLKSVAAGNKEVVSYMIGFEKDTVAYHRLE